MIRKPAAFAALLLAGATWCLASDVVVLKGGTRIELKQPWVQQGNSAILTRSDGTLFSVPVSEIDTKATAAARAHKPAAASSASLFAPPSAPADAVRSGKGEKARVRVTDADVAHVDMGGNTGPVDRGEKIDNRASAGRVEVLDYTQQKSGTNLILNGTLSNPGSTPALNTRLSVTALDETGNPFTSGLATLTSGTVDAGKTVAFAASLPVGERVASSLRFTPQWTSPPPPAPAPAAGAAPAAAAAAANPAAAPAAAATAPKAPGPTPLPYGQGTLYAAPAPSAQMVPPADGRGGYIPGATSPDNQPKTPQ